MIQKKPWKLQKVELRRTWVSFKMQTIPFLRTLDASFFARLVFFIGVSYSTLYFAANYGPKRVFVKQDGPDSATRYSKTFG
jgi:hypothetical protein